MTPNGLERKSHESASHDAAYGYLVGVADEYGTIWQGEPGASERIGDLVQRGETETFEVRLTTRSPEVVRARDPQLGNEAFG